MLSRTHILYYIIYYYTAVSRGIYKVKAYRIHRNIYLLFYLIFFYNFLTLILFIYFYISYLHNVHTVHQEKVQTYFILSTDPS